MVKITDPLIDGFVEYLKDTLIPDLMESGHTATAEDFVTTIEIIEHLRERLYALDRRHTRGLRS